MWDIEEIDVDSQLMSKHATNEGSKDSFSYKTQVTETGQCEPVKEVPNEVSTGTKEQVIQPAVSLEKQEKPVIMEPVSSHLSTSEKVSKGESLEVKGQQPPQETFIQKPAELPEKKTEQTSQHQPSKKEIEKSDDHQDSSLAEQSKKLAEDSASGKTAIAELQTLHKRENSSGSVDSSWSKLSEEELKANGDKEGMYSTLFAMCMLDPVSAYMYMYIDCSAPFY